MKVPWPQPFEDGDVRAFLEDFEDVAEVVGVKTERGKLVALRSLLKGRAKAVLEAAANGQVKMEWTAAKEALLAGFNSAADRREAMRQFKEAQFPAGGDPLVYAMSLKKLLRKSLPDLNVKSEEQMLCDQFVNTAPPEVAKQLELLQLIRPMQLTELADAARELLSANTQVLNVQSLAAFVRETQKQCSLPSSVIPVERPLTSVSSPPTETKLTTSCSLRQVASPYLEPISTPTLSSVAPVPQHISSTVDQPIHNEQSPSDPDSDATSKPSTLALSARRGHKKANAGGKAQTNSDATSQPTAFISLRSAGKRQGRRMIYKEHRSVGATRLRSRKLLPKWKRSYKVAERQSPIYLIRSGNKQDRIHGSQLTHWSEVKNKNNTQTAATRRIYQTKRLLLHTNQILRGEKCCDAGTKELGSTMIWNDYG